MLEVVLSLSQRGRVGDSVSVSVCDYGHENFVRLFDAFKKNGKEKPKKMTERGVLFPSL